ncbi:M61 family metallopeptidase [Leptolyngbyaceae cyanobacterium UHCC 1019]
MNRETWEPETGKLFDPLAPSGVHPYVDKDLEGAIAVGSVSRIAPVQPIQLHYQVAMSKPESHLFEVTLHVSDWQADTVLNLKMPVWTPGSYLIREYARHLQNFSAVSSAGSPLPWRKVGKNHWQIDPQGNTTLTICYQIYANELSVRTNHLDSTHGYFNGAALFFYSPGYEQNPIRVEIIPPRSDWQITTTLPAIPEVTNTFEAIDFDTLVDSPFEIGNHQLFEFEALGKPHQLAVYREGNLESDRLISDIQRLIQVEANLFGGLPYDRYLFLLHLSSHGFGGLEHKNSCSLIYQRFGFRNKDKYDRFIQLVAHEFFHLWNVKRIRPKALEVFDYEQENYTPSLWFSEGTTSYYDLIIPYRAGIYDIRTYLNGLSKEISRFLTTPGRLVQPLAESSFDAWVKLYRQDANSPNTQMSYYLKGEMVSLLLDLLIRERHSNKRSLDDVLRLLWEQFGQPEIGFTPEQLQQTIETVAGTDLSDFFQHTLNTTEELPFDQYLKPFGLRLLPDRDDSLPVLGFTLKTEQGRDVIKFVESGSPAQQVGIDAGDELLAINGIRISADQLSDRLRDHQPGDSLQVTWFHQDELRQAALTLSAPRPTRFQLIPCDRPTRKQEQLFHGWLGVSLGEIM